MHEAAHDGPVYWAARDAECRASSRPRVLLDAVDQLNQDWQRLLAARLETVTAARTYEAEARLFELGQRNSTDVLCAPERLAEALSREVRALADYEIYKVDIAFATGTLLGRDRVRWSDDEGSHCQRRPDGIRRARQG